MKSHLALYFILFFVITSCDSDSDFEADKKANIIFDLSGEVINTAPQQLVIDENNPNNKYIRIDSTLVYGFGLSYVIPDSLKESDLKIIVRGKMRESAGFNGGIAITMVNLKDSIILWDEFKSVKYMTELNKWVPFKDSTIIYKGYNSLSVKALKIFPFMNKGKGTFDVDDLTLEIIRE